MESQDSTINEQTEEVESMREGSTKLDHVAGDDCFIKRNIQVRVNTTMLLCWLNVFLQLASDAGSLIAMTEEEKKRLEQLLTNDDDDEEGMSGNEVCAINQRLCSAICLHVQEEGETHNMELIPAGFTFSEDDMEKLKSIDRLVTTITNMCRS